MGDVERARAIYNLAVEQAKLDMPEIVWKAYIDFEIEIQKYNNVQSLYKKLLNKTQHVKVTIKLSLIFGTTIDLKTIMNNFN